MKTIRAVAVPVLLLMGATALTACGDTEPKATPAPTESAMMEDDDMMSPTPSPAMSEDAMEEDKMEEDDAMEEDDMMSPEPTASDDMMSDG